MPYLTRPRDPVARSKRPDWPCRRHPKHQQSPGVCSLCLAKKLSRLPRGRNGYYYSSSSYSGQSFDDDEDSSCSSSSSLSSYDSSCSDSSSVSMSPDRRYGKSRSVCLVPRGKGKEEGKGCKVGFWSRLIPGRGRKSSGEVAGLKLIEM